MSWLRLIEESMKAKPTTAASSADKTADAPTAASDAVQGKPSKKPKTATGARFRHLIGEMWPAYLIEIVVIILGISITLALEEWRDDAKEEKLEKIYRANLLTDIDADLDALSRASSATTTLLAHGESLLRTGNDPAAHALTDTALTADLRAILGRPNYIPRDATFADLKSSGNLHLIKDVSLKGLLFAYYNQAQLIKENQESEQQATITLVGPYFMKRFSLDGVIGNLSQANKGEDRSSLVEDTEFRNLVLLRVGNRTELLALYQTADSLATQLKSALQKN